MSDDKKTVEYTVEVNGDGYVHEKFRQRAMDMGGTIKGEEVLGDE